MGSEMCIRDSFHIAGEDWINMYQFAREVAEVFDLDTSLVMPVPALENASAKTGSSGGLDQNRRPDILGLDCTQTSQRLGFRALSVVTGLREMLAMSAE